MTLRLRLVLGLVALVVVGLAVFGITTYVLYARSEYRRLDDRIRASVPLVTGQLYDNAGLDGGPGGPGDQPGEGGGAGGRPKPPILVPAGTYAELRSPSGAVVPGGVIQVSDTTSEPDLPDHLDVPAHGYRFFTTGSSQGSGRWRVSVSRVRLRRRQRGRSRGADGGAHQLAERASSSSRRWPRWCCSPLLATGSWLILRRGLRPLEQMASSARSITAGDLSQRVTPADARTEVGQLGLALNTMLGEIEAAFREREATEHRLRQFLADASHELRTPLTSIQGFAELFRLGPAQDRVELAVILRRIEEETARMKVLVNDLLLLARLDETRAAERAPVDLAVLAADACSDAVAADPGRGITLDAPEPVVVSGDRDHLRQAIANLVTNALKHTTVASPIEVSALLRDGAAVVVVRDHGPGLDADALEHAFDRFWQADHARVGRGAGLGLSIVAAIAHEHGGTATAANATDGGAVFTLDLPLNGTGPAFTQAS